MKQRLLQTIILAAVIYLSGKLAFALAPGDATALWPGTGLALAALLLHGRRLWPGIFVGTVASLLERGHNPSVSVLLSITLLLQTYVAAFLVDRYAGAVQAFDRTPFILRFVLITFFSSAAASAASASGLCLLYVPWERWFLFWRVRVLADFVSMIVLSPFVVLWSRGQWRLPGKVGLEAVGSSALLVTVTAFALGEWHPARMYFVLLVMLWMALRFGRIGAVSASALVAVIIIGATAGHGGLFPLGDVQNSLFLLQVFLCSSSLSALVMAVLMDQRRRAEQGLRLQYQIGRVLSEASDLPEAVAGVRQQICTHLHWEKSCYWEIVGDTASIMRCDKAAEISQLELVALSRGVGLLGRTWETGRPCWSKDLTTAEAEPLAQTARQMGMRAGLAFPVSAAGTVIGVAVFFSRQPRILDAEVLEMCAAIGAQLSQFRDRKIGENAVRQSETQFRFVWESSSDGMRLINEDGIILTVNEAYCRLVERPREFLVGKPFFLMQPEDRHAQVLSSFHERFRKRKVLAHLEEELVLWNGKKLHLEISNSFLEGNPPVLLSTFREISERKRAESLRQEFSLLGQQLSAASTPVQAARTIVGAAQKLIGWDACAIDLLSAEADRVVNVLTMDTIDGQRLDVPTSNVDRQVTPRIRRAVQEGGYLILHDKSEGLPAPLLPFGDVSRRSASVILVPIRNREKVTGVLSLHSYSFHAYGQVDLDTMQALADHCGGALERIRVAEELREQQEFLRTVFDLAPNLISVKDRQHRFTWVNRAYAQFFGKTPEAVIGKTDAELNARPEEVTRFVRDHDEILSTGQDKMVWEEQCTDAHGNLHWLQSAKRPLFGPEGVPRQVLSISTDITERKRVERRNAAFTRLAHDLHTALSAPDAARIISKAADELFGWDAFTLNLYLVEGDRQTIQPLLNVDTIDGKRCLIAPAAVSLSFNPREIRAMESGGELILKKAPIEMTPGLRPFGDTSRPSASLMFVPIRNRTSVLGVISAQSYQVNAYTREDLGILQALAGYCGAALERIRAENALRESDALKGAIMESALDCIITTDREGRIMEFNSAAQSTFGHTRDQVIGKDLAGLIFPPPFQEKHRRTLREYAETGNLKLVGERVEVTALRSDGTEFPAELAMTPLHADSGPIFTAFLRDITERKRTEKAMREIPGRILEAQESERMRVARELHDSVNQILSSTKFRLDSIEESRLLPSAAEQNLVKARELLDRAMHEIWRISRNLRPSELDDLGLIPAVRSLCHEFEDRTGVAVSLALPPAVELSPEIELIMYRIIQESLNNVDKHSEATTVKLSLLREASWLVLEVEDNGIGFKTSPPSGRRGSGMGLVGMKERAAFVGGTVEIQSGAPEGTTIRVRIPINSA